MGFKETLLSYFPHRYLDVRTPGTIRLFRGLGKVFDYTFDYIKLLQSESNVMMAEHTLGTRESEYGLPLSPALNVNDRRLRIISRMQELGGAITTDDFESALGVLSGCTVKIVPYHSEYILEFHLIAPDDSIQLNLPFLEEYVERNKLAHLDHLFVAQQPTEVIQIAGSGRHFDVKYPRCGTFRAKGDATGSLATSTVAVVNDARGFEVKYPRCGTFVAGRR